MATVGRKGPPGKGRSGTGVQWDQQISTQGPVQSEKATSFLVCELPGLCFFCPWGLRGLSAPRAALAVEKHKERRQNTACSLFSPPREEPGGVAVLHLEYVLSLWDLCLLITIVIRGNCRKFRKYRKTGF